MFKKKSFKKAVSHGLLSSLFIAFGLIMAGNAKADEPSPFVTINPDGSQTFKGYVPAEVQSGRAKLQSHLSPNQFISIRIALPYKDQAGLSSLLQCLYDPSCPGFHQFLTSDQFTQQFPPSDIGLAQIKEYLNQQGISVTGISGNIITANGPVPNIEHAFGVRLNNYVKADGTAIFAPDRDPTIPAVLHDQIAAIGGLDNSPIKSHIHTPNALTASIGTGPAGGLAPGDIKKAYNLTAIPTQGKGQTIALFELDGYSSNDITAYKTKFNLPDVPIKIAPVNNFNGGSNTAEVPADIELAMAIAPQNSTILVYEASDTGIGWIDEWNQIASSNKAKIISSSWGDTESSSPFLKSDYIVFQQMAAQGQAVFVAAGDDGAYDDGGYASSQTLMVDEPADQPFITSVGISTLTTNPNGTYNNETASIDGGGGVSLPWAIPSYQLPMALKAPSTAHVSTTKRNVPDVALNADPSACYAIYFNGSWGIYWGSSLSSPIWAAFISLVNQGLEQKNQPPLGFINPLLYQIAATSNYTNDFHAITTGNNGYYPAVAGYNDATGLGSFNGLNLYNDLIKNAMSATAPSTPTALSVASLSYNSVELSWNSAQGASYYTVKRSSTFNGPYTTIASTVLNTSYFDSSVISGNTYYYVVSSVNPRGQSSNSAQVQATIPFTRSPAPTSLRANPSDGQVTLYWNTSNGAILYNVKRATVSSGPYTVISQTSNLFYIDGSTNPLTDGTAYYYVISAVNAGNIESLNSAQVKATPVSVAPLAPTNLSATAGNNQVSLTWKTSTTAGETYIIERETSTSSTTWKTTSTSYTDTSAQNGTTYFYEIWAKNAKGVQSAAFASGVATPNPPQTPLPPTPAVPTGLSATFSVYYSIYAQLSWNTTKGAVSYTVKRSTSQGGAYTTIAFFNTSLNFIDSPLTNGTTYYYVVSAVNANGVASPNSAPVSIKIALPPYPTGRPSAIPGNNQVELLWDMSQWAMSYNILRATVSSGPYIVLASGLTSASYVDKSAKNGTTYYYEVLSVNANGVSPHSQYVQAMPVAPPAAPTGLSATAGNNQVSLSWKASTGAATYNVLRSTGGTYTVLTSGLTSIGYVDTSAKNGTLYYYVVESVNTSGISPNSQKVQVKPVAPSTTATIENPDIEKSPSTVNFNKSPSIATPPYLRE